MVSAGEPAGRRDGAAGRRVGWAGGWLAGGDVARLVGRGWGAPAAWVAESVAGAAGLGVAGASACAPATCCGVATATPDGLLAGWSTYAATASTASRTRIPPTTATTTRSLRLGDT